LARGWNAAHRVRPSTLSGANGIRFGPDGQLYVAQFLSSQVSVIDVENGRERGLFAAGSGFVAPDDLAFDDNGVLFATEVMDGRVSARLPDGSTRVVAADLPGANGIAIHRGRLFVDEFRPGGRILELYADKSPRVIAEKAPMPNAMCAGPDDLLYYPAVAAGQVWRVHPDRGSPELFLDGLAMPTSVKFSPSGDLIVTEAAVGRVSQIGIATRSSSSLAMLRPGLDNCAFDPDGRLFVSHFIDGGITEILSDGAQREVVAPGLLGPWGIDVDAEGVLYVADGMRLVAVGVEGRQRVIASYTSHGFPGFLRNLVVLGDGSFIVSTSAGAVARCRIGEDAAVLATGLDRITGLAIGPGGAVIVAESGTGRLLELAGANVRVLASGLGSPMGLVCESDGGIVTSDANGGRILGISAGETRILATGLQQPHGLVAREGHYFVVDRGARTLLRVAKTGAVAPIAAGLPMGASPGMKERVLPGTETLAGPLIGYSGLAVHGGNLLVACDGDGSVLEFHEQVL
jgi:sugar lactone lactonase YvrE